MTAGAHHHRRSWQVATLLPATITTGLVAGVFGDWAHTIMRGLGSTDDRTFGCLAWALVLHGRVTAGTAGHENVISGRSR